MTQTHDTLGHMKISLKSISSATSSSSEKSASLRKGSIEETYVEMNPREHVWKLPDTYIGSVEPRDECMWVFDNPTNMMVYKKLRYIQGLYKIFDEVLVNAIDQHTRLKERIKSQNGSLGAEKIRPVKNIHITIDRTTGEITIENDGEGIPVEIHQVTGVHVPTMIFGKLLTSSNYAENQERIVGGKNGYGAKLANIFSTQFVVQTVDEKRHRRLTQRWSDHMEKCEEPLIETYNRVPYTRISFIPDYARFGLKDGLDEDSYQIMCKRAYDAAACTGKDVNVTLNGVKLTTKEFESYVNLYIGSRVVAKRVYFSPSDNNRWEIVACTSPDHKFRQVSFVNGICTIRGGKHVTHVADAIAKMMADYGNSQSRKKTSLKAASVRDNLWVFVKADIVNPAFDTQTKECLTTTVPKFGSKCKLSAEFIEKLAKTTKILEYSRAMTEFKENIAATKSTGNGKSNRVTDSKSTDAHYAGTASKSSKCHLIVTEGDSAATFAYTGLGALSQEQRKYFGVFPLKGKPLNAREKSLKTLMSNNEILRLMKMLNLQYGADYSVIGTSSLRYGSVWLLTDADTDGDHIKGLSMNLIECHWSSLTRIPGFFKSLYTPRVKVWKNKRVGRKTIRDQLRCFYGDHEYRQWKEDHQNEKWEENYYKGLGTYEKPEIREVFQQLQTIDYVWDEEKISPIPGSERNISEYFFDLFFNKKLADDRKVCLQNYDANMIPDYTRTRETFGEFFREKYIQYSREDAYRSIPHMDGLKPTSRKVIYSLMDSNLKKETVVAQVAGTIQQKTAYHHGEQSMYGTIIGLGQDFPGSGNINLLYPSGEFGSRIKNGKDHASPRYIKTKLCDITRFIFRKEDDPLLTPQIDNGVNIEPECYYPIFPTILTTRPIGIGTGWSSYVPSYNPQDVYDNLIRLLNDQEMIPMIPWIRGFNGYIQKSSKAGEFLVRGCYRVLNTHQVEITELPIGHNAGSYQKYKEFLENELYKGEVPDRKKKKDDGVNKSKKSSNFINGKEPGIIDFEADITSNSCRFLVSFDKGALANLLTNSSVFEKEMKLVAKISTNNMHVINYQGYIKKYHTPEDILEEFFKKRLEMYEKRREYIIDKLENDIAFQSAKYRFVTEFLDGEIKMGREYTKDQVIQQLTERNYPKFASRKQKKKNNDEEEALTEKTYEYLLRMSIGTLTKSMIEKLKKELDELTETLELYKNTTSRAIWTKELGEFLQEYQNHLEDWFETYLDTERLCLKHAGQAMKLLKFTKVKPAKVSLKFKSPLSSDVTSEFSVEELDNASFGSIDEPSDEGKVI